MKKAVIALFACFAVAGSAFAGTAYVSTGKVTKEYKQPYEEPFTCFADQEFQLDLFGSYTNTTTGPHGDGFGGGLGLNFFFHRHVGIGASVNVLDAKVNGYWDADGRIIVRWPIDEICLAPYLFGGAGVLANADPAFALSAGGGLEYRVIPHKLGIYAEGRYVWAFEEHENNASARLGVRIVF